jgi:hypothetical protein
MLRSSDLGLAVQGYGRLEVRPRRGGSRHRAALAAAPLSSQALAAAVARMVEDIHYANFKDTAAARQGPERAHVYGEIWNALRKLKPKARP